MKNDKTLSCVLLENVSCPFRKSERFGIMNRCLNCPVLKRLEREMDEEDERVMDEIDRVRSKLEGSLARSNLRG